MGLVCLHQIWTMFLSLTMMNVNYDKNWNMNLWRIVWRVNVSLFVCNLCRFRKLFVSFSSYTYANTLKRINPWFIFWGNQLTISCLEGKEKQFWTEVVAYNVWSLRQFIDLAFCINIILFCKNTLLKIYSDVNTITKICEVRAYNIATFFLFPLE